MHIFALADEMETYTIFVTTPDVKGAGTDANVYIMIYGDELETGNLMANLIH